MATTPNEPHEEHAGRSRGRSSRRWRPFWFSFAGLLLILPVGLTFVRYYQEGRAQVRLQSLGAQCGTHVVAPDWIRDLINNEWLRPFTRIDAVLFNFDPPDVNLADEDLSVLEGLSELQHLSLNRTRVTDDTLKHLERLHSLKMLRLVDTDITDDGLKHLATLPQLETLDLMRTRVTDEGMKHLRGLTNLRELHLGGTDITDAGLEQLESLEKLESLVLRETHRRWRTNVSAAAVAKLKRKLPGLRIEGP
jgi:Leucine rich repeat/Leucine Rich repeat